MAEDWLADVKKYEPNADETAVRGIIRHCGIALQKRDSSLVSFSDSTETDRVRENFLKKKLGLTDSDASLDAAIAAVGERMKADRTKNRVTVYYLLAEQFGKLDLFGGTAKAAAATATGAGDAAKLAAGAGVAAAAAGLGATAAHAGGTVADTTAAAGATVASTAGSARAAVDDAASRFADVPEEVAGGGFGRWWPWLLLALLALALFFALKSCMGPQAAVVTNTTETTTIENVSMSEGDGNVTAPETAATPTAVPTGAGVVAGTRDGLPMLTVYFATAKSDVTPDFDKVAATIKDYVTAHPGTKLAVSGFNDPTGSAAVNAKLSKSRAEAVGAALGKLGIPAGDVSLEKPADTTVTTGSNAEARRVEVTVKQ